MVLPKPNQLHLRALPNFFKQSHRLFSPYWTIWVKSTPENSQVTVIVPKKQFTKATQRNAMKRLLTSTLQPLMPKLKHKQLVLSVKKSVKNLSTDQVRKELQQTVNQVNRYD